MGRLVLVCVVVVLTLASVSLARTWYITDDGMGDAPTIQAGIDSAAAGDTVLAACGTYYEHDIVMKSGVCLRSETGDPLCATIDAQQQGRVIYCNNVNWNTAIEGFTITGGYVANGNGGGIWCGAFSYPRFVDLVIADNEVSANQYSGYGGGLCLWESSARLTHVAFLRNTASGSNLGWGGGMYFDSEPGGRAAWLTDVTFLENSAGACGGGFEAYGVDSVSMTDVSFIRNHAVTDGGAMSCNAIFSDNRYVRVTNSLFMQNSSEYGGAVYTWDSDGIFEDCTFAGNSARLGGAMMCFWGYSPDPQNCTFYGNHADYGSCLFLDTGWLRPVNCILAYGTGDQAVNAYNGGFTFTCCDIHGNEGGDWIGSIADQNGVNGNFSSCPAFCDAAGGDFHLCDESPCLPGNHPAGYDCGLIGAWGQGCICGPSVTEQTSWGAIKAMYK